MITVGKVLRKCDKEYITEEVLLANGFQKEIETIDVQIKEIVRNWEKSRAIELFECSEKGALALLASRNDLDQNTCVAFVEADGAGSWKNTGFTACSIFSSFKQSYKTLMPLSVGLSALLEKRESLKVANSKAERELNALLSGINSSKMLLEQFPDFAKFIKIENSGTKALVPIATVEAVKNLLNVGGDK